MGNFFNKSKSPPRKKSRRDQPKNDELSEVDNAKLELRKTKTKLKKYQKQMTKETIQLNIKIKQLIQAGNKSQAKANLRLKKLRQTALEKTDAQLLNLEQMISSIDQTTFNAEMVRSIQTGNEALASLHKIMSIEYVEDVMEEADELEAMNSEITELITGSGYVIDDDEVLADLENLLSEVSVESGEKKEESVVEVEESVVEESEVLSRIEEALNMPVAPSGEIGSKEDGVEVKEVEVEETRTLVGAT